MSSCRIYEEDTKAHYKVKPYSAPVGKGKQKVKERRPRKKDTPAEIVCYTCGEKGHKSNDCTGEVKRCFRCGKKGHTIGVF